LKFKCLQQTVEFLPASFGHYAVLSFVVRGKSPNSECSFQLLCLSSLTPET